MNRSRRWLALLVLLPLLTGCSLFGETPTPLPWIATETPITSAEPQDVPTTDSTTATPTPTEVPPSPTLPATETPLPTATATARPTETPVTTGQAITLIVPGPGQRVDNPMQVRGQTLVMPFEGGLVIRVFDAKGQPAAEQPIIAQGEIGGPATFDAAITYGGIAGPGRVEVVDYSPRDGSVIAQASQDVVLTGFPGGGYVEMPSPMSEVTLPIKLLARVGTPGQQVKVTVRWADGTLFDHDFTTLGGLDGRGLLIAPLDHIGTVQPPPPTQTAAVEISTIDGSPLAWQPVKILAPQDPGTMGTNVYWVRGEEIVPRTIRIPRTLGIARASLQALLWGPVPGNTEGYTSAIPSPEAVLSYPGRDASWGERVEIRDLKIVDGVAYADFSLELNAHSGGALQVTQIREQIEATLRQFSTVDDVVITVNGQPAMLEP